MPGGDPGAGGPGGPGGEGVDLAMLQQLLQDQNVDPAQLDAAAKQAAARAKPVYWRPKTAADQRKYAQAASYLKEILANNK
jgi:hypothetical protein